MTPDIPPLPTPFPLPTPGGPGVDMTPLWDYGNVGGMLSALQSIILLANQNKILSVTIALAVIALCVALIVRSVASLQGEAPENV